MRTLLVNVAVLGLLAGCSAPSPRLNAPPHGVAESTSDMQSMYTYMTDNALLADMSIADIHFVPHRPMLSTLGEQRLSRLAALMEMYGGAIRLNTDLEDQELLRGRMQAITDFLRATGLDATAEIMLPGGPGMDAREVILIKLNEGTYKPKQSKQTDSVKPLGGASD